VSANERDGASWRKLAALLAAEVQAADEAAGVRPPSTYGEVRSVRRLRPDHEAKRSAACHAAVVAARLNKSDSSVSVKD